MKIYGDSWCFSYIKVPGQNKDLIFGKDLAECLSIITGKSFENFGKRRLNNREILDTVEDNSIVVQTDQLRDEILEYRLPSNEKGPRYGFSKDVPNERFGLIDIVKDRLDKFYSKLPKNCVLFSGASKVDTELAEKHGLRYIDKSATEILIPGYTDSYFFDYHFTKENHDFLCQNKLYKRFRQRKHLDHVLRKNSLWSNNDLFANRHATEKSNFIIAEYIACQLN